MVREDPSLQEGPNARKNIGEAALYGIYYDDTEYDYMQHLRSVDDDRGEPDDDTEAVWIPSAVQPKDRGKSFALRDEAAGQPPEGQPSEEKKPSLMLPASAFASKELPHTYSSQYDVDPELQGLQPDMDPHLRQTLEALEGDDFVDNDLDADFFQDIVRDGPWDGTRDEGDTWRDQAPEGDDIWLDPLQRAQRERAQLQAEGGDAAVAEGLSLEARMALFKAEQAQKAAGGAPSSGVASEEDEERDELGSLAPPPGAATRRPAGSVSSTGSALGKRGKPGALARRAASTKAGSVGGGSTLWSMSSSAMFRNKGLTDLDDRFDKVIREYGGDPENEGDEGAFGKGAAPEEEEELDPETVERLTRKDLDSIMDDFLEHHEVVGGRLKQRLGDRTTTADEKLEMVRRELGEARLVDGEEVSTPAHENPFLNPEIIGADREKWDVETVRTTKTNLENHPRTINAAESVAGSRSAAPGARPRGVQDADLRIPRVKIHPRTGIPQLRGYAVAQRDKRAAGNAMQQDATPPVDGTRDVGAHESEEESEGASDASPTEGAADGALPAPRPPPRRNRNETKEERRARKQTVKESKQVRRTQKAANKKAFGDERKRQAHASQRQAEAMGGGPAMHLA